MLTYMTRFSYTNQAAAALVKNPEDRGAVFSEQVEKMGGKVLTVEALLLAIRAPGHLENLETIELHPVEVAMEGMRRAGEQSYRGPNWAVEHHTELWGG